MNYRVVEEMPHPAMTLLDEPVDALELICAGGAGNEEEYKEIVDLAGRSPYPITFTGRLDQKTLAHWYNQSDISCCRLSTRESR